MEVVNTKIPFSHTDTLFLEVQESLASLAAFDHTNKTSSHPTQRPARRSYNGDMLYQWFWRNMKKDLRSGALVIQARKRAQPIGEDAVKKNVTKDLADDDSISIDSDSTGGVDITPVPAPAAKPRAPSSARSEGLFVRQSIEDNPESLNQLHQAGVCKLISICIFPLPDA